MSAKIACWTAVSVLVTLAGLMLRPADGSVRRVEVRPEVSIPAYDSDLDRLVSGYERLVDRLLDQQQQRVLEQMQTSADLAARMARLESRVDRILGKLERIERALGLPAESADAEPASPATEAAGPNDSAAIPTPASLR